MESNKALGTLLNRMVSVCCLALLMPVNLALANTVHTIINEVDADQSGTDSAEFIELFDGGVGDTDLTGLTLVLYNGSSDTSYQAFDLDGLSTNEDGYFVLCGNGATTVNCDLDVSPDTNLIQNGADAVALYHDDAVNFPNGTAITTTNLLDAIVYDTNDPDDAGLLALLNPGQPQVNEGGNGNQTTESNQRCEDGSGGELNTDTYQQHPPTPGMANSCGTAPDIDFVINEVDADTPSIDDAEFVELYDGGLGNSDLSGLTLVLYNGSDDASYQAFDLDGQSTNNNGYFVLCGDAANVANCDLDVGFDTNLIQNGADAVALYTADASSFPNDTPLTQENLIDALVYDTNDSDDAGLLPLLNAGQPQVNEDGNGNKDTESNQRCIDGSGGALNTDTFEQHLPSPGFANTCGVMPPSEVVINEVDADQSGTDSAEFIELFDGGVGNTDLSGLSLVFYNGNGDASYQSFDLDGFSTDNDGYFVLCANATNTVNCDLDVSPDTNLIQNGADAVALYQGNGTDFPPGTSVTTSGLVDAVVYDTNDSDDGGLLVLLNAGQPQVNEGGSGNSALDSIQRCSNGSGGLRNTDTFAPFEPTPGSENVCGDTGPLPEFGMCGDPATFIHLVQGNGVSSPLDGTNGIIVEAVVTANFQGNGQLGGFYLQEEDTDADADASTSEGLFINTTGEAIAVGDTVRVQGTADESFGLTQLTNVNQLDICSTGSTVAATSFSLPVASLDDFEAVEGMSVMMAQPLVVNENFNLGRFGEVLLGDARQYQFTHNNLPDAAGYATHLANLALHRIILDDASTLQNPDPVVHPAPGLSAANTLRGGSTTSVSGIMSYGFGSYRIQPTDPVLFVDSNPRTLAPAPTGGNFRVASINVLNYFTTLDTGGATCGPNNLGCRGADSAEEFTRQRDKILNAIHTIDADVVGLVELENNATQAIGDLVAGLNSLAGAGTYAFIDTGTIGTDAIKVGFIYKPATATPEGAFAILDQSVDPLFIDTKNRPALAQTFSGTNGDKLTIAVNHLKSKGSACDDVGDPNLNDGQANCSGTRANAATALKNWLMTDPTGSNDPDVMIIGDLNAYAMEVAVTNLTSAGFTNLIDAFAGATSYSFIFGGEAGYLDHALASDSLTAKVTGVTEWHINADEPRSLDYNTEFKSPAQVVSFYAPDAYRMSDHDPVIVGFDLMAPPVPGDWDMDGDVDINDLLGMIRAIQRREVIDLAFDFNNDNIVNMRDIRGLMAICTRSRCAANGPR